MTKLSAAFLSLSLGLGLAPSAAWADSFASSASSASSASVGSVSDSIGKSSDSSSGGDKKTAAGTYRVTEMAKLEGERVRLHLAPAEGQAAGFTLTLPLQVATAQALQPGATLHVAERGYGYAFAGRAGEAPFFLAVDDRLRRDFESVKL